jgi:tungstate transport system permease protein
VEAEGRSIMGMFWDSLAAAVQMILALDRELYFIVYISLKVALLSTLFAGLIGVPAGFLIAFHEFRFKSLVLTLFNTLLAVPTVVVGLFVYVFISRRGILGPLDLLYTQKAMVIGQVLLVLPIVVVYTVAAVGRIDQRYRRAALTLGASGLQTALTLFREARFGLVAALAGAFGRVIAEVGVSMMLGGNIKGFTRTMPTAMALEYDKGEFILAVALGLVLLLVSFGVNGSLGYFRGRSQP